MRRSVGETAAGGGSAGAERAAADGDSAVLPVRAVPVGLGARAGAAVADGAEGRAVGAGRASFSGVSGVSGASEAVEGCSRPPSRPEALPPGGAGDGVGAAGRTEGSGRDVAAGVQRGPATRSAVRAPGAGRERGVEVRGGRAADWATSAGGAGGRPESPTSTTCRTNGTGPAGWCSRPAATQERTASTGRPAAVNLLPRYSLRAACNAGYLRTGEPSHTAAG